MKLKLIRIVLFIFMLSTAGQLVAAYDMTISPDSANSMSMGHSVHVDMNDSADSETSLQLPCCDSMGCNMVSCMALMYNITNTALLVAAPSDTVSDLVNNSFPNSLDSLYRPPILS